MLPIDLLRRSDRRASRSPDESPVLIIDQIAQRRVVAHACERARAMGITPGLALADARGAMAPAVPRLEDHDPAHTESCLGSLALWATRFAPAAAPDPPDGLMLDISGCARVWGGEANLADSITHALLSLGLRARVAIAPSVGGAWALARHSKHPPGQHPLAHAGNLRRLLTPFPTAALRLEPDTLHDLARLGIDRVEHLLNLPRRTLPARFGDAVLLRLDQALGEAIETIEPARPTDPPRAERVFDGSTDRWDAIERTVRDLLDELGRRLLAREIGALRVSAELARTDLGPAIETAVLSRPSRDARHLWSILRPKLERTHLGFGVERVRLTATRVARLHHEQAEHWRPADADQSRRAGELLDTLGARFGPTRIGRAELIESHIPERAARWSPVLADHAGTPTTVPPPGDRPTVLLDPPAEARVLALTPDGPVLSLAWKGEQRRIERCLGPERIGPEWWAGDTQGRDYFKLQDDAGRWIWAFRETGSRRWCVHGVWA